MNSQQTKRSLLGLLISLLIHGSILGALFGTGIRHMKLRAMRQVKYPQRFQWK